MHDVGSSEENSYDVGNGDNTYDDANVNDDANSKGVLLI